MDRSPVAVSQTPRSSTPPSTESRHTSAATIKALEVEDWHLAARTVSAPDAQAVLDDLQGRDRPCEPTEAATFARNLLGLYPARDLNSPETYATAMTALMAAYPRDFVKRVCNPVTGLPSRLKFLPTLADVREALDLEAARRSRIAANARFVVDQAAKRAAEAEEEARFKAQHPNAEKRAQQVRELLRGVGNPAKGATA